METIFGRIADVGDPFSPVAEGPGQNLSAAIEELGRSQSLPLARIGRIVAGRGVRALRGDGSEWQPDRAGYAHFDATD